jgi:hypothetical protein
MAREGLTRSGLYRELYVGDWDAAGAEDPVCDAAFPMKPFR